MVLITRKAEFSASHYCASAALSPQENEELYGPASRPSGHGHNYVLEVTVAGDIDPASGMIMDLKDLKQVIQDRVVEVYDHRFLNHEVPPFDRVVPTPENIVKDIWERLTPALNEDGRRLHGIRLYETADLYVDYFGEDEHSSEP